MVISHLAAEIINFHDTKTLSQKFIFCLPRYEKNVLTGKNCQSG